MSKVNIKKQKKKNALMESAYELFTTEGFIKTTIRDITHKAGVAKGTFYLYFKDKTDIREAVIKSTASQLLQEACNSLDEEMKNSDVQMDVADIFVYIIDYLVEVVAKDDLLVRFIAKHLSWGLFYTGSTTPGMNYPTSQSDSSDPDLDIEQYVINKLGEYKVRIKDLKLLLFTLLELVSSTCHDVILYQQPVPLEEYKPYLNNCIRLLVNSAIEQTN